MVTMSPSRGKLNERTRSWNRTIWKVGAAVLPLIILVNGTCTDFGKCCVGRNNSCNSTIVGVRCYCDEFCGKSGDCCQDYEYFCRRQDCVVTYWSHWNECSARCGRGRQSRTRQIHIAPSAGGEPCGKLRQERMCHDRGHHCPRKETAMILPTYYKPYRGRPSKYFPEKPKRPSYCVRYYLTYISPYCAHDTPWYMMKARDSICVECQETAMNDEGLCKGSLPKSSDSWVGIATHHCYGRWKAQSEKQENCQCGHKHGYDFIFV